MVTGISLLVKNLEENPPPRKYPRSAAFHVVASVQALISLSVISQNGFTIPLPFFVFNFAAEIESGRARIYQMQKSL